MASIDMGVHRWQPGLVPLLLDWVQRNGFLEQFDVVWWVYNNYTTWSPPRTLEELQEYSDRHFQRHGVSPITLCDEESLVELLAIYEQIFPEGTSSSSSEASEASSSDSSEGGDDGDGSDDNDGDDDDGSPVPTPASIKYASPASESSYENDDDPSDSGGGFSEPDLGDGPPVPPPPSGSPDY